MKRSIPRSRGPFVLRLPAGKPIRFADARHFGEACGKLSSGRFASLLDFVTYARALPNGYSSFMERTD